MKNNKTKQSGFTLVELLIVIVVIAILAAISIVSYQGIQERAQVAKVATAFNHYVKILEMYKIKNGHYPYTTNDGNGWVCLGETSNYPAKGVLSAGQCGVDDFGDVIYEVDPAVTNALRSISGGSLPDASYSPVDIPSSTIRGLLYAHWDNAIEMTSYTKGDSPCPLGKEGYISSLNITICTVYTRTF